MHITDILFFILFYILNCILCILLILRIAHIEHIYLHIACVTVRPWLCPRAIHIIHIFWHYMHTNDDDTIYIFIDIFAYWIDDILCIFCIFVNIFVLIICMLCISCILCISFLYWPYFTYFAYFVYKTHFSVFRCLFPLLLGPPFKGPAVHLPPPTSVTTVLVFVTRSSRKVGWSPNRDWFRCDKRKCFTQRLWESICSLLKKIQPVRFLLH